jgi:hypothetical protein
MCYYFDFIKICLDENIHKKKHLFNLSKNENESFKKLLAGYTDYQSGIKMHQFSSNLISKINQSTSGKKRTAMMEAFPEFDKFLLTPENNLSGFHALNKINNDILSS